MAVEKVTDTESASNFVDRVKLKFYPGQTLLILWAIFWASGNILKAVEAAGTELDVPGQPGHVTICNVFSREIILRWEEPKGSVKITHYAVDIIVAAGHEPWNQTILTETNQTSYKVTGLTPYTPYQFGVSARNGILQGAMSDISIIIETMRETPEGKPNITMAMNISSTMIRLGFQPPPTGEINGELLGFRLCYQRCNARNCLQNATEIYIRDPKATTYTIKGLLMFTQYLLSLQVYNMEGLGPATTTKVFTDEGGQTWLLDRDVGTAEFLRCQCTNSENYIEIENDQPEHATLPEKPENVTMRRLADSRVQLRWSTPLKRNGKLKGFRIFHEHDNITDVATVQEINPEMKFILPNLKPFADYKVWVKAFSRKHEGQSSNPIFFKTDVRGPSQPNILNAICLTENSLLVEWSRPYSFINSIDIYYVQYWSKVWGLLEEVAVEATSDPNQATVLKNLTTNILYGVRVIGGTKSVLEPNKVYKGENSETRNILIQSNCLTTRTLFNDATPFSVLNKNNVTIAMCVVGVFCLLFLTWWSFRAYRSCQADSSRDNTSRRGSEEELQADTNLDLPISIPSLNQLMYGATMADGFHRHPLIDPIIDFNQLM